MDFVTRIATVDTVLLCGTRWLYWNNRPYISSEINILISVDHKRYVLVRAHQIVKTQYSFLFLLVLQIPHQFVTMKTVVVINIRL